MEEKNRESKVWTTGLHIGRVKVSGGPLAPPVAASFISLSLFLFLFFFSFRSTDFSAGSNLYCQRIQQGGETSGDSSSSLHPLASPPPQL